MTTYTLTDSRAYNFNLNTDNFSAFPPTVDLTSQTFMHTLAREGDVLSAEVMFDAGAEIDGADDIGHRPLHEAAFFGHLEMVDFLLAAGAKLEAPIAPFGHTALYLAVQQSRYSVVNYLIKHRANLSATDRFSGNGLLHVAASKNDLPMLGILLAAGLDIFKENKKGMTARDLAAIHGNRDLERTLLKIMAHQARYVG